MIMFIHPCLIFSQVSRRLMKVSVLSSANAMYLIGVMINSFFLSQIEEGKECTERAVMRF